MVTQVSSGIKVSVKTKFEKNYSNPKLSHYFFSYKIEIVNTNDFAVQLLRRHWFIFDSNNSKSEVKGEGVVGQQPVIDPGNSYVYESGCNLRTGIGKMHGNYQFVRLFDEEIMVIQIPEFTMMLPELMN